MYSKRDGGGDLYTMQTFTPSLYPNRLFRGMLIKKILIFLFSLNIKSSQRQKTNAVFDN